MGFANTTEWELRTTGNDANGGGFDVISTGTDYSQQDAAQVAFTDLVIDATTNTNCTSAAHPFDSTSVGNIINIVSGTGFTVQRVQVVSVAGGVATCDKSLGTLSSTGGVGNLGGGLLTLAKCAAIVLSDTYANSKLNTIHVKAGTYVLTAAVQRPVDRHFGMVGYQTTHRDGGTRPLFTTSTNSIYLMYGQGGSDGYTPMWLIENVNFSSTASTPGVCMQGAGGNPLILVDCKIGSGFTYGVYGTSDSGGDWANAYLAGVEITGCSLSGYVNSSTTYFYGCNFHNNGQYGCGSPVNTTAYFDMKNCLITDNGSHGINGILSSTLVLRLTGCIIAKNGGSGVYLCAVGPSWSNVWSFIGNVFALNTGPGLDLPTSSPYVSQMLPGTERYNAFYGNNGGLMNVAPFLTWPTGDSSYPPFLASASQENQAAYFAFNRTAANGANTFWQANNSGVDWLQMYFGKHNSKLIVSYSVMASGTVARAPKNWTLKGSNDGSSWTTLDTQTNQTWTALQTKSFSASGSTPYTYFRLDITANSGGGTYTEVQSLLLFVSHDGLSYFPERDPIILTTDPFTNSAVGDYTLNSTSGGGAALSSFGVPFLIKNTRLGRTGTVQRGRALPGFSFPMFDSATGAPKTGLTITAKRTIDGAAFASCTNSATEISDGWYVIELSVSDLDGICIGLKFSGTGALDTDLTLFTQD